MNSSSRSAADIWALSSSRACAGSRNWRRNTRSRYLAWKAVIDGSMPWPVTSPITAATRARRDPEHVVEVAGHHARARLVHAADLEAGDVGQVLGREPLRPATRRQLLLVRTSSARRSSENRPSASRASAHEVAARTRWTAQPGSARTRTAPTASLWSDRRGGRCGDPQHGVQNGAVQLLAVRRTGDDRDVGLGAELALRPAPISCADSVPSAPTRPLRRSKRPRRGQNGWSMAKQQPTCAVPPSGRRRRLRAHGTRVRTPSESVRRWRTRSLIGVAPRSNASGACAPGSAGTARAGPVGEQGEGGRVGGALGGVEDPTPCGAGCAAWAAEMTSLTRPGRHPPVVRLDGLGQRRQQSLHARAGEGADLEHRRCRRGSQPLAHLVVDVGLALPVLEQLPLVEEHDHRAAGHVDALGQALVLVGDAFGGVDDEQRGVGAVDRLQRPDEASSTRCRSSIGSCGACRRCRRSGSGRRRSRRPCRSRRGSCPGMSCTTERSSPISRLNSVDLPTFGRPTMRDREDPRERPSASAAGRFLDRGSGSGSTATSASSRSPVPRPCSALTGHGSPSPRRDELPESRLAVGVVDLVGHDEHRPACLRSSSATRSSSSVMPTVTSTTKSTTSASAIARSLCRLHLRRRATSPPGSQPPVSTSRNASALPLGLDDLAVAGDAGPLLDDRLAPPDDAVDSVDLPTLGRPTMATVGPSATSCSGAPARRAARCRRSGRPRPGGAGRRRSCRRGTAARTGTRRAAGSGGPSARRPARGRGPRRPGAR